MPTHTGFVFSVVITLISAVWLCSPNAAQGQNDPGSKPVVVDAISAKALVGKIGTGNEVTLKRKDGVGFYGLIGKIEDESVTIADVAMKANIQVRYDQIQEITAGRTDSKPWNGKAKVSHTRRNIALITLALAFIPIIVSASRRP